MNPTEILPVPDTPASVQPPDRTGTTRRYFLQSMAAALAIGPALLQAEENEDEKKAALAVSIVVKHMNAAFERGELILDANKPDARDAMDLQIDKVLVEMFKELNEKGIEFSGKDSVQKLSNFLRQHGYFYTDGAITTHLSDDKGAYIVYVPMLNKIRTSRRKKIDGYMKEYLTFSPGSDAEVLSVGGNLIDAGEKAVTKKLGGPYRVLGTTERKTGGAAVIFEQNIRARAEEIAMKNGKPIEKVIEEITADVEVNEIFHVIFRKMFQAHIDSVKFTKATFTRNGRKFTPHNVDEAFSDLGTILYGKSSFVDLLNQHIHNKASEAYELSNILSREVAEDAAKKLGIPFQKGGKIDIPSDQLEKFEKEFKDGISRSIMGMLISLHQAFHEAPKVEKKDEK